MSAIISSGVDVRAVLREHLLDEAAEVVSSAAPHCEPVMVALDADCITATVWCGWRSWIPGHRSRVAARLRDALSSLVECLPSTHRPHMISVEVRR